VPEQRRRIHIAVTTDITERYGRKQNIQTNKQCGTGGYSIDIRVGFIDTELLFDRVATVLTQFADSR